jgi:hypothetical protein
MSDRELELDCLRNPRKAADRIRELEAALKRIADHHFLASELYTDEGNLASGLVAIARAALEPSSSKRRVSERRRRRYIRVAPALYRQYTA